MRCVGEGSVFGGVGGWFYLALVGNNKKEEEEASRKYLKKTTVFLFSSLTFSKLSLRSLNWQVVDDDAEERVRTCCFAQPNSIGT